MSLPYTYKFQYDSDISPKIFFIKLKKVDKIKNLNFLNDQNINFTFLSGIFGLSTDVDIEFNERNSMFSVEISLNNVLKIIIILIIIFAFIVLSLKSLFIVSSISIIIIYTIVIFHIKNSLMRILDEICQNLETPEKISDEQKSWILNDNLCPGCGTKLIEFDEFCPECTLNLKNRRIAKKQNASRTGFENFRIEYNQKKSLN